MVVPRPALIVRLSFAEHDWVSDCESAEDLARSLLERIPAASWRTLAAVEPTWHHAIVPIDIWHAETDTIEVDLARVPEDLRAFAKDVYAFCPDIVD